MVGHHQLVEDQASRAARAIAGFVRPGQDFALVDFPHHSNIGDSAIWLGELALFRRLSADTPSYVSTVESYSSDALREACPSGPIFVHGGGNFGDIYPKHQQFRIRLMADFPDRRIVQLPQSISFGSPAAVADTAAAIARHGGFTLLVRDEPSLSFGRANFDCPIELVPDTAFGLGPIERPVQASSAIFMLLREDTERAGYDRGPLLRLPDATAADWIDEPGRLVPMCAGRSVLACLGRGGVMSQRGQLDLFGRLARARVRRGLRMLASGEYAVADRLHAHILLTMMNVPHVVLDNSYGKIEGYLTSWTGGYSLVRRARDAEEAIEQLKTLSGSALGSTRENRAGRRHRSSRRG